MIGEKRNAIEFGGAPNDLSRTGRQSYTWGFASRGSRDDRSRKPLGLQLTKISENCGNIYLRSRKQVIFLLGFIGPIQHVIKGEISLFYYAIVILPYYIIILLYYCIVHIAEMDNEIP